MRHFLIFGCEHEQASLMAAYTFLGTSDEISYGLGLPAVKSILRTTY